MKHELGLLENGLDSLNEALRKFQAGENGDQAAYKFSVLHFSHAVELLFKYYVSQSHPLLIYRNPFSKNLAKENTIGLWDAVQFLRNEEKRISSDLQKDLEWIKQLRNDIEHYKFQMDVHEVRRSLGRLIRAAVEFSNEHDLLDLSANIAPECADTFETLANEYLACLVAARAEAPDRSEDDEAHDCVWCGERAVAALVGAGLECLLCGEKVMLVECCQCGCTFREIDVSVWNDDHPPHIDHICYGCETYIFSK